MKFQEYSKLHYCIELVQLLALNVKCRRNCLQFALDQSDAVNVSSNWANCTLEGQFAMLLFIAGSLRKNILHHGRSRKVINTGHISEAD